MKTAGYCEAASGPATTRIGPEKAWRSIMGATEAAAAQAGLTREDFARMHVGIGLAGLGHRGAESALNKIAHPFASVIFISDGLAACLGAHSGADGAIVVAGTGSVGVGMIDGREIRLTRDLRDRLRHPDADAAAGAYWWREASLIYPREQLTMNRFQSSGFKDAWDQSYGHRRSRSTLC
jgi:hypothetical protein